MYVFLKKTCIFLLDFTFFHFFSFTRHHHISYLFYFMIFKTFHFSSFISLFSTLCLVCTEKKNVQVLSLFISLILFLLVFCFYSSCCRSLNRFKTLNIHLYIVHLLCFQSHHFLVEDTPTTLTENCKSKYYFKIVIFTHT